MKKTVVALFWLALVNAAFAWLYAEYSVRFNPKITHDEAYRFGETYGMAFFVISIVVVTFLAAKNKLPGARERTPNHTA
ncbi:hypothetical protein [Inhella crocodyli]|uniref:Uncharacterized protein n=1 Tax=Inhella crocodyli TaxID=2499851 RepID=A0A3S2U9J6_9BURK|nr:hypothetical protein [Inhella crocodyli]RVT82408.1 hypothetical protein EOD73_16880 [Inhella crocodyli]